MAHGDNHAKQIVIQEAKCLADKLTNGESGCVETQGRAMALLVKMITPLYMAEFITVQECGKIQRKANGKTTKLKLGPIEISGPITRALMINLPSIFYCVGITFILGKSKHWW